MMAPVPGAGEGPGVGGEFVVDGGPVRGGQAGGFADQQGGAPFVELPGLQGGEGVRHFGHEGFGQAQEPAALGGGFAPGQGDLRPDPGAEFRRGHPGGGLFAALEQVEGDGEPGLAGRGGGLQVFELPELINHPGTVSGQRNGAQLGGDRREGPATVRGPGGLRAAVSCRNRVGLPFAVHESSVDATYDNLGILT